MGASLFQASTLLATALLSSQTLGNFIVSDAMSFGHDGVIRLTNNAIKGWNLFGEGHAPQMLSDRVILTPPAPGNTRGAMWSETPTTNTHWLSEISFRASGQDRGSGNFQIWFAKDGQTTIGSNSLYTAGKFQGLAILVDQHGGHGGMLRAFLNDGSRDYKSTSEQNVDSLAFGHCNFAYRNLGAPSKITLVNDASGFRVDVDERQCFYSEKINLPAGYRFGMTASTAEDPDSFEVSRFVVSFANNDADKAPPPAHQQEPLHPPQQQHDQQQQQNQQQQQQQHNSQQPMSGHSASENEKQLLELVKKQEQLITQLQNDIKTMIADGAAYHKAVEQTMKDMNEKMRVLSPILSSTSDTVKMINNAVSDIKRNIESQDVVGHIQKVHQAVDSVKQGVHGELPDALHQLVTGSAPKMGLIIFIFVGVQATLFVGYLLYKKRRDSAPKKYL